MKKETIERQTENVILQQHSRIQIGHRTYRVAQPTAATLIMLSAEISQLPMDMAAKSEMDIITKTLRYAKDCGGVGRIVAIMLVGAWWGQFGWIGRTICRRRIERKGRTLLARHTSRTLNEAMTVLIRRMQVADFFALTAFLSGINITKATKAETTASGQR